MNQDHKATEKSPTSRKWMVLILPIIFGVVPIAAAQDVKGFWADPINHPLSLFYLVIAIIGVTVGLVLVAAIYMLRVLNLFVTQAKKERAEKAGLVYRPESTWWEKAWDSFNASVPLDKEKDIDLGHEYDGIRELDNHLPPWWKGLFYGCVIWAFVYMVIYHYSSSLPLSAQEYENELATVAEELRVLRASQPVEVIDENTLTFTRDENLIANGKKVFMSNNCGSCHRNDGGGNAIGPNLTDPYWVHGGSLKEVFLTIKTGVIEKGMPAWGKVMSPSDVRDVAFFVMSLQGSNPVDSKKAEGKLVEPEPSLIPADSVKSVMNP